MDLTGHPLVQQREIATLTVAEHVLTGRCIKAHGFEYQAPTLDEIIQEQRQLSGEPYAFSSRKRVAVAVRGRAADIPKETRSITVEDRYVNTLSLPQRKRYGNVVMGGASAPQVAVKLPDGSEESVGIGGCRGESLKTLYGDAASWVRLQHTTLGVRLELVHRTEESQAYKTGLGKWRACAAKQDIRQSDPFDAASTASKLSDSAQTAAIAAIWDCEQSTGLRSSALAAERSIAPSIVGQYERDILAYRETSQNAMKKAEDILASGA